MKWFKRKSRNRRLEREHVLEVRLNSQQLRAARLRFAGISASVLFGIVFVGFVFWRGGEWMLNRFIYENEAFAVRNIEVQTDGVIATNYIFHCTMIKPNQNLLALDLARVKRDLELVPMIKSASVERTLPNSLKIRVAEREPMAQIQVMQLKAGGGTEQIIYQLDDQGFVFKPLDLRLRSKPPETNVRLPIISGVDARELRIGRRVEAEPILAALQLLTDFEQSSMLGYAEIIQIDVSTPETLHIYTAQGSEVFFSLDSFDQQLRRWRMVYDQTRQWGKAIGYLDLSVANNAPLRLVEATPSTAAPKAAKPTRVKRRNV